MRKIAAALAVALWMPTALAANSPELQGSWQVVPTTTEQRDYVAIVIIDSEGRVTYDSPLDQGRPANFRGYISKVDPLGVVQMTLTDGAQVARINCTVETPNTLRCRSHRNGGTVSDPYLLRRVGPGVGKLNQ